MASSRRVFRESRSLSFCKKLQLVGGWRADWWQADEPIFFSPENIDVCICAPAMPFNRLCERVGTLLALRSVSASERCASGQDCFSISGARLTFLNFLWALFYWREKQSSVVWLAENYVRPPPFLRSRARGQKHKSLGREIKWQL